MNTHIDIDEYKVQEHSRHDFVTRHLQLLVKDSCVKLQITYNPRLTEQLYNSFLETYSLTDLVNAIKVIKTFAVKLISYFVVYTKLMRKMTNPNADIQSALEKTMSSMRVIHIKALDTYYLHHPSKSEVINVMSKIVSLVSSKALLIVFQLYLLSRPNSILTIQDVQKNVKVISYI